MHTLLNTLYLTTAGTYAHLDGDTVIVEVPDADKVKIPILHLGGITCFGRVRLSTVLMQRFAKEGKQVTFHSFNGRFHARVVGPTKGNVLLRTSQFEAYSNDRTTARLARRFVEGKLWNARTNVMRGARESDDKDVSNELKTVGQRLKRSLVKLDSMELNGTPDGVVDTIRGIEGEATKQYFSVLNHLIKVSSTTFNFENRNKRPPRDAVNALLSFGYSILTNDCVGAVEGVGLDPQIGFLHVLRPGRPALALDLMEEFRFALVDRVVLNLINRRQIGQNDFEQRQGGAVEMSEDARKTFLTTYQERKSGEVQHPLLEKSVPIGLLPHIQARILARRLRGEISDYTPYLWK